jgi:hypothetical protein
MKIIYLIKDMKTKVLLYSSFVCLIFVALTGCAHHEVAVAPPDEVIKDSAKNSTVTSLDMLMSNIPTPTVLSKELSKEGVQLNKSLLNSPDKGSSYSTTFQQAVNMGIYGADLGYLSSYNQMQDVLQYFAQISKLGNSLGITSVFDQKLAELFKNAASNNKDTLNALIQASFERAQKELYSNKRATASTLIFAGGWIEGLYIATNMVNDPKNDKNQALYQRIWDHVYAIRYLQQALADEKSNADCTNMLNLIKPIGDISSNLSNDGLQLKDVQNLKDVVTQIRSKLI